MADFAAPANLHLFLWHGNFELALVECFVAAALNSLPRPRLRRSGFDLPRLAHGAPRADWRKDQTNSSKDARTMTWFFAPSVNRRSRSQDRALPRRRSASNTSLSRSITLSEIGRVAECVVVGEALRQPAPPRRLNSLGRTRCAIGTFSAGRLFAPTCRAARGLAGAGEYRPARGHRSRVARKNFSWRALSMDDDRSSSVHCQRASSCRRTWPLSSGAKRSKQFACRSDTKLKHGRAINPCHARAASFGSSAGRLLSGATVW